MGRFGLEDVWLPNEGFPIFEGVRRADLAVVAVAPGNLGLSEPAVGVRILETGSCGNAEVGGGAGCDDAVSADILKLAN